jgi:hypothetical protein
MNRRTMISSLGALGLAGCATYDQNTRASGLNMIVDEALAGGNAAAFITLAWTDNVLGVPSEPIITFQRKGPFTTPNGERVTWEASDDLNLAGITPGDYALLTDHRPPTVTTYNIGGWANPAPVASFSVTAGEVVYLGHLRMGARGPVLRPSVEDKFDEFKGKLRPDLAAKLQKRLVSVPEVIQFGPAQTSVMRY